MSHSHDGTRRPAPDSRTLPRVDTFVPTVLAWRALNEWDEVKGQVVRSDARVAELLLGLVRDTAAARYDEKQLLDVVFTVGQYNLVSWALNSIGVELDPGVPGGFSTAG
jgi:hypothetical protein